MSRGVRGERGPTGDHGQTGDTGLTGHIGETGDIGETGARGEQGVRGATGKSTRLSRNTTASFVALAVVSFFVLSVFAYQVRELRHLAEQNRQRAMEGQQAHDGLCALRRDLRDRVTETNNRLATTRKYLRDHPKGAPGIPVGLIRNSIATQKTSLAGQRSTLHSLVTIHCERG